MPSGPTSPSGSPSSPRTVNRRGQGSGLRREILDAAADLLAETSSQQAVTLRGIARRAGIAAPSIYPHFRDRDAVVDAVVTEAFADLAAAMTAATDDGAPAAERVRSLCRAYVDFAARSPGRYRVLFERSAPNLSADSPTYPQGLAAFELLSSALADAVTEGSSSSAEPPATPGFPWAPTSHLLEQLVTGLGHLRGVSRARQGR